MPSVNPSPSIIAGAGASATSAALRKKKEKELEAVEAEDVTHGTPPDVAPYEEPADPWTLRRAYQVLKNTFTKWEPRKGKL